MPIVASSFNGNKWFKGKHAETIIPALFRSVSVQYTRTCLELVDGDFIDLDWHRIGNRKLMVLFHGLEGSAQSQYIKGFVRYFSQRGYDCCAVNFRGCSGQPNRLLRSYHSGATDDIDAVMNHIANEKYDILVSVGFSLGGNVLLKYLGEKKYPIPTALKAAIAFSVPCDLEASAYVMAGWQNKVYMQRFLKSLDNKMRQKALQFPEAVDLSALGTIRTFHEFDNLYTGPMHGFKNAQAYYQACNSLQFLAAIQHPVCLVNAKNDPFLAPSCFPISQAKTNPYLFLEMPQYGGHVGFSEGLPNQQYWSEKRAEAFINEVIS
ncbi:MAG: alpha/beta fold hydrolase [Bacteroidia bacterium]|jgi:hypothetical protein|nr:alpha/beta fold hydrolase [Bacteroidia bacterium]